MNGNAKMNGDEKWMKVNVNGNRVKIEWIRKWRWTLKLDVKEVTGTLDGILDWQAH